MKRKFGSSIPPVGTNISQTGVGHNLSNPGHFLTQPEQNEKDASDEDVDCPTDPGNALNTPDDSQTPVLGTIWAPHGHQEQTPSKLIPGELLAVIDGWEQIPVSLREGILLMVKPYLITENG
ncbi:MAG: hypothetical protein LUH04_08235 [Clostridium sp.]|nr:hypothetical protein [Clostridium sp.]